MPKPRVRSWSMVKPRVCAVSIVRRVRQQPIASRAEGAGAHRRLRQHPSREVDGDFERLPPKRGAEGAAEVSDSGLI
jgi:hypothetical protein